MPTPTSTLAAQWTERLTELMERHQVPAASIGISQGGTSTVLTVGLADVPNEVPATGDTRFHIASIGKIFTATLVMQLVDARLVDLDAKVNAYVPRFRLADGRHSAITVRQLLNHTSGIPGDHVPDTGDGPDCLAKYVESLADLSAEFEPGALSSYSNAGMILAGHLVEEVHGMTYDDALLTQIAKPLGLSSLASTPQDTPAGSVAPGHLADETGTLVTVGPDTVPRAWTPAGGGMVASARDVLAFVQMHLRGGLGPEGDRLLSVDAVDAMQRRTVDLLGVSPTREGVGLGWHLQEWPGARVIEHSGQLPGHSSLLLVLPDHDVAVVTLTNGNGGGQLNRALIAEILEATTGQRAPERVPSRYVGSDADVSTYIGHYRSALAEFVVGTAGDGLHIELRSDIPAIAAMLGGSPTPRLNLVQIGEQTFAVEPDSPLAMLGDFTFVRASSGTAADYLFAAGRVARRTVNGSPKVNSR